MCARAVKKTAATKRTEEKGVHARLFGSRVFHLKLMEDRLPEKVFQNLKNVRLGKETFDPRYADTVALALKNWAVENGATHFTHWFQPLTGAVAEKHDSFLNWSDQGEAIEHFRGKELLRGEPDASSFPSGGLRSTECARGYTVWDPASFPFLWEGGDGLTLCIPSLFFSWTGFALDHKIPLLRSDAKLKSAVMRLLKLCKVSASQAFSTLGIEQEYFLIDRGLVMQRPDLLFSGRTLYGAPPPKGQELEDHYFGALQDRTLAFMRDFEDAAIRLGIPVKTRHNEVAPAQHEVAPLFEPAPIAVDHNLLLMELMHRFAKHHEMACLFHEKPFANINGSGKHNNWSVATDTGLNLLDPRDNSLVFLIFLTAVLRAVHDHAGLIRASIGSAGNDLRLGAAEAPPAILSVYLGDALEAVVEDVLKDRPFSPEVQRKIDLGLAHVPHHEADAGDRNRTSFFAFTGNKFELRAVGASAHCSFAISTLNAVVADALQLILDEIANAINGKNLSSEKLFAVIMPCLRKHLKISKAVLFRGNAYTSDWEREAEQRGLPHIRKSFDAFSQLLDPKAIRIFDGVLTKEELHSRYEVLVERYAKTIRIEANLMLDLFRTHILPAALRDQKNRAKALSKLVDADIDPPLRLKESVRLFSQAIDGAMGAVDEIEKILRQSEDFGWEAKAKVFCELLSPKMAAARSAVDRLEALVEDALWPMPKYWELLSMETT